MPNRLKDESQDVKGNKFIVSAADFNKHDEEIRAIEGTIGIRRPRVPAAGQSSGQQPAGCEYAVRDVYTALQEMSDRLSRYRDDYLLMASGTVNVNLPSYSYGNIPWPSDWPMTTLASDISDNSTEDEEKLENLPFVELVNVDDLPAEGGFVSIINDAYAMNYTILSKTNRCDPDPNDEVDVVYCSENALGYAGLDLDNSLSWTEGDPNKKRIFGLGTSIEIMEYESIDTVNKRLLNVRRKCIGTTSTSHASGDLVFKGRLSVHVSPVNCHYGSETGDVGFSHMRTLDCFLRPNGSIWILGSEAVLGIASRQRLQTAYATYHAVLMREIEPIPPFQPGELGDCEVL